MAQETGKLADALLHGGARSTGRVHRLLSSEEPRKAPETGVLS